MIRLHLHSAVHELETSTRFYSALFGRKPDYARRNLGDPAVNCAISRHSAASGIDPVGLQAETTEEPAAIRECVEAAGISGNAQPQKTCCNARSDKYWTRDPQEIARESFHTPGQIRTEFPLA